MTVIERKQSEEALAAETAWLRVALDNMPGALVYTDEALNIVFCNEQFRQMYPVPAELLQPGQPYPAFLRYLADNGYYGEGDLEALVARRVESLRKPTGKASTIAHPDGHWYRILRRRSASRRHGHRYDRRDRAKTGRAGLGRQRSPASRRPRQYAGGAGLHRRRTEYRFLQRSVPGDVCARRAELLQAGRPYLLSCGSCREWLLR